LLSIRLEKDFFNRGGHQMPISAGDMNILRNI